MTLAQAASRLKSDASTCGKYVRHGLRFPTRKGPHRLRLFATRKGHVWDVTAEAVKRFSASRKKYGL